MLNGWATPVTARLKLGRGRRRYETSAEAYDLYLHARALGDNQSVGPFEEAIAKDPSFAPAYAGLAAAYALRSGEFGFGLPDEVAKMRTAARKAIQLDPLLAEAHDALGMVYARDGQWEKSEKGFRSAIELDPSGSMSYNRFALGLLLPLGRIEEALHQLRVAEKVDPLSPQVQWRLAWVLLSAGRYLGYAYGKAGRREEAEKLAIAVSPNPFSQALIFAGLGDKDRTLEALDRVAQLGAVRVGRALNSPEFALLRGDPRLKALRKKVGLPE